MSHFNFCYIKKNDNRFVRFCGHGYRDEKNVTPQKMSKFKIMEIQRPKNTVRSIIIGHHGMLFAALYLGRLEIRASKDNPAA